MHRMRLLRPQVFFVVVECEPYISCDDVLMRERAHEVVGGAQILMHALSLAILARVSSSKPMAKIARLNVPIRRRPSTHCRRKRCCKLFCKAASSAWAAPCFRLHKN